MSHHDTHHNTGATGTTGLVRLHELDDYKVADGDPDVRGWDVKTSDGKRAGKVQDLIVDTEAMQVRYLDVELDRSTLQLTEDRHVLVPLANARLDDDHDDVLLGSMTAAEVIKLQPYQHGQTLSGGAMAGMAGAAAGATHDRDRDPREFYGKRGGTGGVQRMVLSEEELRVGKRTRQVGEVDIHKTVETEHVSQSVPVSREDVVVERRPLTGDSTAGAGEIRMGENEEIRIPLNAEEAVIEKRVVPREEVVIRKTVVQGEQTVEADLKRERIDVDRTGTAGDIDDKDSDRRR